MSYRAISVALLSVLLSTSAIAQGGAGGSGAASGAPGSTPSGTAGVSSSPNNPSAGTPGTPGPSNGVGLPGGTGPGNVTTVPNQPPSPAGSQMSGNNNAGGGALPSPGSSGGRRSTSGAQSETPTAVTAPSSNNFHPEAVTSDGLDSAAADIANMPSRELRSLVEVFKACTANEHPLDRVGKCGAVSRLHKSKYLQARQVDRSLVELERVVRFQSMFRTSVPTTEYEDRINDRLRMAARLALTTIDLREPQTYGAEPDLTKDVRLAK